VRSEARPAQKKTGRGTPRECAGGEGGIPRRERQAGEGQKGPDSRNKGKAVERGRTHRARAHEIAAFYFSVLTKFWNQGGRGTAGDAAEQAAAKQGVGTRIGAPGRRGGGRGAESGLRAYGVAIRSFDFRKMMMGRAFNVASFNRGGNN